MANGANDLVGEGIFWFVTQVSFCELEGEIAVCKMERYSTSQLRGTALFLGMEGHFLIKPHTYFVHYIPHNCYVKYK